MGKLLFNVEASSVADQIAMLLNSYNKLKNAYTAKKVRAEGANYIVELGGFNMRHKDGERKVIGCIGMQVVSENYTLLKHLCVHEDFRGKGIATSLINRAIGLCTTPYVQMRIRDDNKPSTYLAEGLGFVPVSKEVQKDYNVIVLGRKVRVAGQQ